MLTKFAPHPVTISTNNEHNNNLFAISFHQWEGCSCFLETKSLILGFAADNAHLRSDSQSSLFRDFVFMFTSAEKLLFGITKLPTLLYMCTYLAQKSVNGIASKPSFAEELHFISKNSSYKSLGRMSSL